MKFLGFKRKDGSVGVRNHVLILPSCACASETCRVVASQVLGTKNVVINVGCSDVTANTEMTQRVLTGFALNANVFGVVVIGLGCETVGHKELADKIRKLSDKPVVSFGIQEEGGTIKTAALAVEAARKMVEEASKQQKVECDASDLFVAIECGGSDATSGIASNPAVGNMADRIYDLGGTTMMSDERNRGIYRCRARSCEARRNTGNSRSDYSHLRRLRKASCACRTRLSHRSADTLQQSRRLVDDRRKKSRLYSQGWNTSGIRGPSGSG